MDLQKSKYETSERARRKAEAISGEYARIRDVATAAREEEDDERLRKMSEATARYRDENKKLQLEKERFSNEKEGLRKENESLKEQLAAARLRKDETPPKVA